ncbi:MAG TPA: T9SS type A sorting domain-containing protein [Bacteroidia bacterium]|nr:T9SS type A sorting domain-containing protein [Bacteroidia bacterium]
MKIKLRIIKLLIVLIYLFSSNALFAQNTFQHSYGTKADEIPNNFIQTTDKGFALLGSTDDNYGYLVKVDSLGNKMWSKEYSISNFSTYNLQSLVGGNLIQTSDKGYLVCDAHTLMKTDSLGAVQWAKYFSAYFNKVLEVQGGYILAGSNGYAMFIKIDFSGNVLWTSSSLNNSGDEMLDIIQLKYDSCFYLIAQNRIIKTDKHGNSIWSKYIYINSSLSDGVNNQIYVDSDGKSIDGFLTNGTSNYWFNFDSSGTVKESLFFPLNSGYESWAYFVPGINNSKIFTYSVFDTVAGHSFNYHIFSFKTDSLGNIKWSKRIGGPKEDYPIGVLQTNDKGIAVFGATQNFSDGADDFYLTKMDSMGNSSCNQDTFHIDKLTAIAITLNNDNVFNKTSTPIDSSLIVTSSNINDTSFNDCSCYTPHADFFYNTISGYMQDSSTWASHWYWSFGDGTFDSTTISPTHQYADTGIYNVCLKVKNACGEDSICKTIYYQNPTLSVKNITNSYSINVYPNPSSGTFNFHFDDTYIKGEMEIYNMMGKCVCNETLRQAQGDIRIDLSNQPAGIYLYRIISENGNVVGNGKLVIE